MCKNAQKQSGQSVLRRLSPVNVFVNVRDIVNGGRGLVGARGCSILCGVRVRVVDDGLTVVPMTCGNALAASGND